ncbi:LysR family transcriptional regulator [Neobacillus drentensis]|uniref:LysR family transcriptional regulator n=1 Tax=Neobacillus drentensis TaxID=220684 RepID=UPI002856D1DF|nr:LysR family transcriptional regulator [Neobacillus drentensis]MDR7236386.1 DNA-binding transcriptional LysR family regulator [Neobacillus drentensis]
MDIRPLRYFISVAEHLNFTEASKHLFVAQPAVSQQIAYLEKKIGVKLFHRTKHSVKLTEAGSVFLKDAREILRKLDESIENARQAEEGLIGTINIGLLSVPVRDFLPRLIRKFRQKYPKVNIRLNFYHVGKIIEKLKSDELDIAFTLSLGLQSIGGLEYKNLWTQPHSIIVHQDHPLANRKSINIQELSQESFVMLGREESPPGFDLLLAACANHGFSPNLVNTASHIDAVLMMVDAGIGITILPKYLQLFSSPTLRFISIEGDDFKVDVLASWKKKNENPSLPLLIEELELLLSQQNV